MRCPMEGCASKYEFVYVTLPLNPLPREGDLPSLRSKTIMFFSEYFWGRGCNVSDYKSSTSASHNIMHWLRLCGLPYGLRDAPAMKP